MTAPYSNLFHLISGRKVVSQGQRMMTSNGATSSSQQNANRTEYLDTSTLKHLQLIAGPSHPKEQLPKGTDFLELANRVGEHMLSFVLAECSMFDFMFLTFSLAFTRPGCLLRATYSLQTASKVRERLFSSFAWSIQHAPI